MQLPPFRLFWHASSLSYFFAWSCSWHSICGKATVHDSFILVTLDSLHIPVHRRRHSYRVIFYLQLNDYNSILEQRWLYMNASGGVPGYAMNQEWHVWKNYEWWPCHKYDVNYMIMQSNMTMMKRVIIMERWKVAWQYISEWLWKCHNR